MTAQQGPVPALGLFPDSTGQLSSVVLGQRRTGALSLPPTKDYLHIALWEVVSFATWAWCIQTEALQCFPLSCPSTPSQATVNILLSLTRGFAEVDCYNQRLLFCFLTAQT